jgi:hypothetical protein
MALHSLGHIASLDALPAAMGSTFEPNAAHRAAYERGAQRHATLYSTLVADR